MRYKTPLLAVTMAAALGVAGVAAGHGGSDDDMPMWHNGAGGMPSMMGGRGAPGAGYGPGMMGGAAPYGGYGPGMGMMHGGPGMMMGGYGAGMGMMYGGPMMGGGGMAGGMGYWLQALDLSDEQRERMLELRRTYREAAYERMAKMGTLMDEFRAAMAGDKPDPARIRDLHDQMADLQGEQIAQAVRLRNELTGLLTDEQREQLREAPMPWGGMHGGW
ncbi:hypothetical protein KBTX_01594 [wastewater metagenome]|uniref:Periplasmic heavy metal sensor n=2 Tax=unclassified sequences TaxID=12908 RepID=A0A5B8RCS0_9ZZZZ|nr:MULTISPECIES: Spy/CpxP family protein refolding chaperone [Arhodomonas]MCS4502629.1 Spy/CpxP family protein refolding chaperone [Arhodomonas aquaeolei]QEA05274.1 hypothetical protein KBTEX_01594 [uncultured organism]